MMPPATEPWRSLERWLMSTAGSASSNSHPIRDRRLPAMSGGFRRGLRIASPEVWFAAYALMGRSEKASLLEGYLHENGADSAAIAQLREEPLPQELAQRLERLPVKANRPLANGS